MKKRLKAFSRTTIALLTAALVCSPFTKAYADDTVDSLEKQTNGLQNQLDSLNQDLTSLSAEITDLASKIEDTDASVQKAELDLAAAKLDEQLQYDAMKKRIKYMYETGNTSLLQIIFSSESMGDFLNKAEFVKNITEYDRNMLDELQKVHELVAKKDSDLKAEQASLAEMKTNLDQQEQELNDKISSTSGELQASSEALAKAKEAQAAAAAALKKKQEEEAAEQQRQAEAAQTAANNTSSSSGNTDSGSSGGNTTITVPDTPAETTDLVLFAAILQCEAGGYNYDGILAVATVIMNRVASPLYPNTISGVVYQSGQSNLGRKLKPRLAKRTCILMLSGRSGSTRRSTACIRKRMLPVPKRKYRNVRDQRWGKCIFLNPVPVDVRSIHSQDRMQKNGIYSSSRVNTVFYFLRIIVCKKLCYQFHTTFHIFFICYLCRHVHITKRD